MNDQVDAFAARLRAAVTRFGGPKRASEVSGVPLSTLNSYLAGGPDPKLTVVLRLAETLGVSIEELLGLETRTPRTEIEMPDSIIIPLLNVTGSAGGGMANHSEYVVSGLPFSASLLRELGVRPDKCHFIRAKGDSMEPTIRDGSVILVDTSKSKDRDDGIYALMFGEDVRIKRCFFGAMGQLTLVSDNPAYPDEVLGRADREQIKIVGKVVFVGGGL